MVARYAQDLPALFADFATSARGLAAAEAARRLAVSGENVLPEAPAPRRWQLFFRQFASPLIYVLLGASVVVFALGELVDGAIILVVLTLNAAVGAVQEGRAQDTLRALRHFVDTTATVRRDGSETVVPAREIVPGDVLVLREGEQVAADARLLDAHALKIDEAAFTGESEPVGKTAEPPEGAKLPPSGQHDMVFKGTQVTTGAGTAVVVATGVHTVIGSIAREVSHLESAIPLQADIRRLSRVIIGIVAAVSVVVFAVGVAEGRDLVSLFAIAVSLAVSIIPEGLPVVLTLILATGVWQMSKRHALVKRLQAVEALGQARVIAVDKTGTVTKNELVVRTAWVAGDSFAVAGAGYDPVGAITANGALVNPAHHADLFHLGKLAALSADARVFFTEEEQEWRIAGDPTEAAIRVFGEKVGFSQDDLRRTTPVVSTLPFDAHTRYRALTYRARGGETLVVSGAPEAVLERCTRIRRGGRNQLLRREDLDAIEVAFMTLSGQGLRVVAFAERARVHGELTAASAAGLSFVGLLGMQDTIRSEVAGALASAHAAGAKVVMITGDDQVTARAIAEQAGIATAESELLTGAEIAAMSDAELAVRVKDVALFARVTPEHKLRIIRAYQQRGELIAMTGDGVNDAPSLVAADLGVAMGGIGTDVAKEAADIILLDDNFGTIVAAIEEGRNIYQTIQKVLLYLFSTSIGEALTILGALALALPLPLLAAQIIWLNFVTDTFLDIALALEPMERGLLARRFAKPGRYLITRLMAARMALMAIPMALGTLFLFSRAAHASPELSWTVALTTLAVFQWLNAWNCRSESESIFSRDLLTNRYLIGATGIVIILQLIAIYTPVFEHILHTVPLGPREWIPILSAAALVVLVEEVRKYIVRQRASASAHGRHQVLAAAPAAN